MGTTGTIAILLACSEQGIQSLPPEMRVEPLVLDFGVRTPGELVEKRFTVTNEGPGTLDVLGIELFGAGFTLLEDGATGALAPGEQGVVEVAWASGDMIADGVVRVSARQTNGREVLLVGTTLPADGPDTVDDKSDDLGDGLVIVGPTGDSTARGVFAVAGGIDLAFLLDTTQSMQALVAAVTSEVGEIVGDLASADRDVRFGLATFEDYPVHPFGTAGIDLPFTLRTPMTDDPAVLRTGLGAVAIHQGQDAPESTMEALRQGLTGVGWDLACDGRFDPVHDVRPYASSTDDLFFGTVVGSGGASPMGEGGFGFGRGRLPVLLYATNYELRDAEDPRFLTPSGCPSAAGATSVAEAAIALGARLVGVAVGMSEDSYAFAQMQDLARATGSLADLDGNGRPEPAVLRWSGSSVDFRAQVVRGVEDLLANLSWRDVDVQLDDPSGVVRSVTPDHWAAVAASDRLAFSLVLRSLPVGAEATVTLRLVGTAVTGQREVLDEQVIVVRGGETP